MDAAGLEKERTRALAHPIRRALRDALGGGEERGPRELARDVGRPKPLVVYHLLVLLSAELVACVGGRYRLA
jgi:DNA-binding transcriptional ArsR family regulator